MILVCMPVLKAVYFDYFLAKFVTLYSVFYFKKALNNEIKLFGVLTMNK